MSGDLESIFKAHREIAGTIFRFPLRTTQLAKGSEICASACSIENATDLFDKFIVEAPQLLLVSNF